MERRRTKGRKSANVANRDEKPSGYAAPAPARRSPLYYDHVMEIPIITNFISRLERNSRKRFLPPLRVLAAHLLFDLSFILPLCRVSNYLNRCKYSRLVMFRFLARFLSRSFSFLFRYRRLLVRRLSLFFTSDRITQDNRSLVAQRKAWEFVNSANCLNVHSVAGVEIDYVIQTANNT